MKKRNGLIKTSLACALIFGGVGLLAGCGKEDPKVTINDIYVTGDYADSVKEYVIGSDVSLAGAKVEVSFSDGTKQTVTITDEMWKKSDYDFTTLGEKTITVKFKVNGEEKSEPITIKIVNPASVQEVIDGISTLLTSYSPQAHAESEAEIVRNNYSALSDTDKALVTNYSEFFNAYKLIKKDVVNTYVELSYYSQDNQLIINGYITTANNAIDNATDFVTIDNAISSAKTQIDDVPTEEEVTLENAKSAALLQFDSFVEMAFSDSSLYTPENWSLVQQKISEFEEKVNSITDVWEIPNINESNQDIVDLVLIDTIASAQYKELLTDLPDVSEVTLEDFDKIESVVEAYEALENDWDKERLSLIYDEIEELYDTVLPLYIDDYKEKALIELNNYVDLDDYYQEQREYIEEEIRYVVSNFEYIENNNKSVISYIDSYIEEAKRDIDWIAPKKIVDIINKINNLPSSSDVTSLNKLIMKIDDYYDDVVAEIENDEAVIDNVTYTIDLVNGKVYLESTEVATITNNEFLLSDETYRIIDVSAEVDSIFNLVGQLSQEEKDKYNINLQNVNDIQRCLDNLETLKEELALLETYKDLSKYTEEGQNEIKSIIDSVETNLSGYVGSSVEEFAEFINDHIVIAKSRMDFVKDAVSVAKSNVAWQLENYVEDYYDYYVNEQDIIKEIIRNARLEANQKTTVEEINAVIEEAKSAIDEVDTKEIVFARAKEEAIQKLYDYINVDDYLDLETKEDLNATGENLPDITKAYQSGRELINNCSDIYNFDEIESCLSSVKESIDEVKRTYEMNITEFDSKITETADKFVTSQDIDDYYVAVAELRHNSRWVYYASGHSPYISTKDGFVQADDVVVKQTKHKTFNIGNEIYVIYEDVIKCNGVSYSISDNKVTINDVEYTISEDGLTYGDSQTIDYNAEEKTVKRLYVSVAYFFKAYSDINIKVYSGPNNYEDTYTIKVTDSMDESEFGLNYHQGTNTGSGVGAGVSYDNDADGGATLTSYNKNASYEFNYCKSGNVCYVGNLLAEVLQDENSETYYYFGKLEGIEDSRISIKALGKAAKDEITTKTNNYVRTVKVYEGNRTSKYYEFELKYVEKVDLTALKTYYKNLINSYDKYDSEYEAVVTQLKVEYSNKIENATTEEEIRNAYEALTNPAAKVGTLEGNYLDISYAVNFKIEDNKVKFIYTGDEVGRRENNRITIDKITFTLGDETTINETTGKGVYINDHLIGIYDGEHLYLHAYETNYFEPIFSTSHELNYSVSGDGTTITVPSQEYIVSVDGETVFISSKLGFKEQVDQYLQTINVDREAIDNSVKTFMNNLANNNESLDKYVELGEIKVDTTKVQVDTDDVLIDGEYISRKKYLFYTTDCNKLGGEYSGDWVYKIYNNKLYMHVGLYLEYAKEGFVIEVANTKFVLEALDSSTDVTGVNTYKEEYINSSAELSDTNVVDITSEAYDSTYGIKFDNLTQKESGYYAYAVITNDDETTYILLEDLNSAEFTIGTNREWTYGDHYLSNSAYEETLNINLYLVGKGNDVERSSASFTVNYNYVATEKYSLLGVTLPKTKYQKGETLDLSGLKVALNDVELTEDQYTIKYAVGVGGSTNFVTLEEFNETISSSYYGYNYVVIESKYKTTSNDYISRAIRIETEIQAPTLVVNETNITGLEIDRYYGRRDVSYIYEIDENTKTVTIDFLNQLSDEFVIFSSYTGYRLPIELPITLDLAKHGCEFDFEIYELDEFGEYSESSLLNGILNLYEDSAVTGISLNDTELYRSGEHYYSGQVNTGNTINVLDIDVESGYTYKLFFEDGRSADKNDIKLNLGYSNSYILKVYDSSNKFVEEIAINFEVSGEVYDDISNNLKVNGEVFNLNSPRVELYIEDVGPADEVAFTGINDINGLTSFKLIDYKGNNLLDSNYKFSMQNMPILVATLEIVIDGNTYYSDVIFTSFEYQYVSTLSEVRVAYDGIELTVREVNNVYVEVEVPKGTIDYSKFEIIVNDYTPYDNPVIERIGETNIFKITYDEYRETPVTSYLILKEGDNTLNNDATIMIGAVNSDGLADDLKEDIKYDLVKENQITVTQTIIDSTSEYYDETVTNYYVANDIKVNQSDRLYILNNDKYQIKEVNGEGFIYYEQWYDVYRFDGNMAEDDNYLVIDVISGDKTVKNRYIIEFERNQE